MDDARITCRKTPVDVNEGRVQAEGAVEKQQAAGRAGVRKSEFTADRSIVSVAVGGGKCKPVHSAAQHNKDKLGV
jgi:hypothetical protein